MSHPEIVETARIRWLECREGTKVIWSVGCRYNGKRADEEQCNAHSSRVWEAIETNLSAALLHTQFRVPDGPAPKEAMLLSTIFSMVYSSPLEDNKAVHSALVPTSVAAESKFCYKVEVTSKKAGRGPGKVPRARAGIPKPLSRRGGPPVRSAAR